MKKVYIIAGEPSGDFIGSMLVKSLKAADQSVAIYGVGGALMESCGLKSPFNIEEISVAGIVEVAPHIFRIKGLIKKTIDDISRIKPDVIVTIDSPGFCFRIAKAKELRSVKKVHYVAPSVWAWRPGRAAKVSKIYDCLLTLFDFEPKYFAEVGLPAVFVGHPVIERIPDGSSCIKRTDDILVMPGSRRQEIKKMLPIFIHAAKIINRNSGGRIIIPTLPHLVDLIASIVKPVAPDAVLEIDEGRKHWLYKESKFAIVASGTATLQLAVSGCPMIVAYKLSAATFYLVRKLVKTKYISLVNIIMNKKVVPELIQNDCSIGNIVRTYESLKSDEQTLAFKELRSRLDNQSGKTPSELAAQIVLTVF